MRAENNLERFATLNQTLVEKGLMAEDPEGQRFEDFEPPTEWKLSAEFRITPEINELYRFALDDDNPWYVGASPFGGALAHPIALLQLGVRPVIRQFPVTIPEGQAS